MKAMRQIIFSDKDKILIELPLEFQFKPLEIIILPVESTSEKKITKRPHGLAKGQITMPDSFFEPLPDDILEGFGAL
ncbi:MAG: hypothetical protein HQM11_19875 [SAR324 cluster bacterium]|nr:hypothetical protein [SAR324 cluster bacterium]